MRNINDDGNGVNTHDDIDRLLHDAFRDVEEGFVGHEEVSDGLNEEARKFFKLLENEKQVSRVQKLFKVVIPYLLVSS